MGNQSLSRSSHHHHHEEEEQRQQTGTSRSLSSSLVRRVRSNLETRRKLSQDAALAFSFHLYPRSNLTGLELEQRIQRRELSSVCQGSEEMPSHVSMMDDHGESGRVIECPICFLFYEKINFSRCCRKPLCTECACQILLPKTSVPCPFCNHLSLRLDCDPSTADQYHSEVFLEEQKTLHSQCALSSSSSSFIDADDNPNRNPHDNPKHKRPSDMYKEMPLTSATERREMERRLRRSHSMEDPDAISLSSIRSGGKKTTTSTSSSSQSQSRSQSQSQNQSQRQKQRRAYDVQVEEMLLLDALRQSIIEQQSIEEQAKEQEEEMIRKAISLSLLETTGMEGMTSERRVRIPVRLLWQWQRQRRR